MAEVLGAVGSVVSIIGLAKTCLELYDIIDTSRNASKDLNGLVASIDVQKVTFQKWCEYVGLATFIAKYEAANPESNVSVATVQSKINPCILDKHSLAAIMSCLGRIETSFHEAQIVQNAHNIRSPSPYFKWPWSSRRSPEPDALVVQADSQPRSSDQGAELRVSGVARVKWVTKDRKKLQNLLDNLRHLNADLTNILGWIEKTRFLRQHQLRATTAPYASMFDRAGNVPQEGLILDENVGELIRIWQRNLSLRAEETDSDDLGHRHVREIPSNEWYLFSRDLGSPPTELPQLQTRIKTTFKGAPALVEWKYYSRAIDSQALLVLQRRVALLNSQLQQSSQISGFSVLNCIGHFNDEANHRIGIVFKLPSDSELAQLVSLREIMAQDRRKRKVRELGSRLDAAKVLVMTFFRLHSVAWLHKGFNSENVIFFETLTGPVDECSIPKPYVCGFDFSRQDRPDEMTERMPSILQHRKNQRALPLYRHPDLNPELSEEPISETSDEQPKSTRYEKRHDVYSLGIVLLEIGLWKPIKDLCKEEESNKTFSDRLQSQIMPELQYRMGNKYFEVVKQCLQGDFDQELDANTGVLDAEDSEEEANSHDKATRIWLENFERDVVSKLETCSL